jgi:hypothetical protein
MKVEWTGPYAWPTFEELSGLPAIPKHPGIYLWTAEYRTGYLIYAAGITRRPIPFRFKEHTAKYRQGEYTILDMKSMNCGIRKEIWHGWGWSPEKRKSYEERKTELIAAVKKQLSEFRIFVADVETIPRILERLEAGIMNVLYEGISPYCDIPDKGMRLSPRWECEQPIIVEFLRQVELFGLPIKMVI